MIVDLVRNDLSKTAQKGSVKVEELFGIYPFPQVHQMISTVTSKLRSKYSPLDVVKNSFPMGSMTGAPKIKAMELIEKYEVFKRGLYAGSIGYFSPEGDFDFNVVIRSLFYNKENQKLGFAVGGAITIESDPNKEYEETLLKAKAIFQLFANS
jgi:para-aminobenzoate synthetase component 1